jgi:hypothetical protein
VRLVRAVLWSIRDAAAAEKLLEALLGAAAGGAKTAAAADPHPHLRAVKALRCVLREPLCDRSDIRYRCPSTAIQNSPSCLVPVHGSWFLLSVRRSQTCLFAIFGKGHSVSDMEPGLMPSSAPWGKHFAPGIRMRLDRTAAAVRIFVVAMLFCR